MYPRCIMTLCNVSHCVTPDNGLAMNMQYFVVIVMIATFHHAAAAVDTIDRGPGTQPSTETALIDTKTRWIMLQPRWREPLLLIHSVSLATVAHLKTLIIKA